MNLGSLDCYVKVLKRKERERAWVNRKMKRSSGGAAEKKRVRRSSAPDLTSDAPPRVFLSHLYLYISLSRVSNSFPILFQFPIRNIFVLHALIVYLPPPSALCIPFPSLRKHSRSKFLFQFIFVCFGVWISVMC